MMSNRSRQSPKTGNSWILTIFFSTISALAICLFVGISLKCKQSEAFPFSIVEITTTSKQIPIDSLKKEVLNHLHGGYFSLNQQQFRWSLLQNPWIYEVKIHRVWPDRLKLQIIEQQPLALWNEKGVINNRGEIFYPPQQTALAGLPHLLGAEQNIAEILTMYYRINKVLERIKLTMSRLQYHEDHQWTLMLNNGVAIYLGGDHIDERLKRFVENYSLILSEHPNGVSYIDLRYPSGIAILPKNFEGQQQNKKLN